MYRIGHETRDKSTVNMQTAQHSLYQLRAVANSHHGVFSMLYIQVYIVCSSIYGKITPRLCLQLAMNLFGEGWHSIQKESDSDTPHTNVN
jgi:hypothetical protein